MSTTQVVKVTNGTVGVVHTAQGARTLCGRDAADMLTLSGMAPWERMGWDAASKGACMRCAAKLAATPRVAPITVDSTPAGIFAAMMRANSREEAAPQSRLYGLLSDYLRRTLTRLYGQDGDALYCAIVESGEASDDVISSTLATQEYLRADALAQDSGNRFFTAPDDIARELRHVMPICRDWRAGLTEFASIGQHGTGYWTVTQGHTASGRMMERTDERMIVTCVTRFKTSSDALAAVLAHGYR